MWGLYYNDLSTDTVIPTIKTIPYTRFDNIDSNCNKIRVLGAGLKLWSEEAPINTGGYSIGGWITLEDLFEQFELGIRSAPASDFPVVRNAGALSSIQTKIKYSCRAPGVKGSTVRYSTLQDQEQLDPELPKLPQRLLVIDDQDTNNVAPISLVSPQYINDAPNSSMAIHDVIIPGSYVPCIYWSYNAETVYTLKLMSMVHSEATPDGNCPFTSGKCKMDPAIDAVRSIIEDPERFPAAVTGHSFTSFFKKASYIVAKVSNYASRFSKFMALAV
jgi:hypothetical protein